jgi:hypothetical protein
VVEENKDDFVIHHFSIGVEVTGKWEKEAEEAKHIRYKNINTHTHTHTHTHNVHSTDNL